MLYKTIYKFNLTCIFLIISTLAFATEHFGVQVYGGARPDKEETTFLREKAGADSYFYRTSDSVKKVAAFYQKLPGITSFGSDEHGGMFVKEDNRHTVYIKVQSPWQPSKGEEMEKDTCIVITRE